MPPKDTVDVGPSRPAASRPIVSVLMAVHNGLPYLDEAVDSILNQTITDFEFIIVDDGSTDGSSEWLSDKATTDPRIRVISQSNTGIARALNHGLRFAQGRFVARMDADDVSCPTRFEVQVRLMERDPGLVIVGSAVEKITATGQAYDTKAPPTGHDDIRKHLLLGDAQALVHPVAMIRKEIMDVVAGYDERFTTSQDLDLFLRLTERGRAANVTSVLLQYRQHNQSSNSLRNQLWRDTTRMAIQLAIERIGPEAFAREMFPHPIPFRRPTTLLEFAKIAAGSGRLRMANQFALQSFRARGTMLEHLGLLLYVWLKWAVRWVQYRGRDTVNSTRHVRNKGT